jgi:hypothetical protein
MKYRIFFLTQPDLQNGKLLTVLQPDHADMPTVPEFNSMEEAYQFIKKNEESYRSLPVTILPFLDMCS